MTKKNLLFCAFFLFLPLLIFAQEETISAVDDGSGNVYVIRSVNFTVDGRTKDSALFYHGEFIDGERIEGTENFEKYIVLKQQLIYNKRNHDVVFVEYTLGEPEADGALPVDVLVYVKDTWNFIILPEPKYDSNEGFSLTLKARDYNFLGTMSPLRLDIGYMYSTKDDKPKNIFSLELDSDTPFYAAGLRWNLNFDNIFNYSAGEALRYKNVSGLSVELPVGFTTVKTGVDQYFIINEENSQSDIEEYGLGDRFDGAYAATELYGSWKIPTGIEVINYGVIDYTVSASGKIAYSSNVVDESRRPVLSLGQNLGFGKINWKGNYREGFEASIGNTNKFYFDPNDYHVTVTAGAVLHHRFAKVSGISARIQYRQWFNGLNFSAASVIRGFPNSDLRAENMLSMNIDLPFWVLRFAPSDWFDTKKMRIFDFDMHLSPFLDMGFATGFYYYHNKKPFYDKAVKRNFTDGLFGSGFELIVFPDFFRSLYLRISAGYNLNRIYDTGKLPKWDELFIGIGHHY